MKVKDIMTDRVIRVHPEECVAVAARQLASNHIGAMPVCGNDGRVLGVVTDRDLVIRCMAAGRNPASMTVGEVMSGRVVSAGPEMDAAVAAHLMGRQRVRRLPVVENGKLCGMVSLGDLASCEENVMDAADALMEISNNVFAE